MKNVIMRALFKAASTFLGMLVIMAGLQYMAWHQYRLQNNIIIYIGGPELAPKTYAIVEALGLYSFHPDFWPF
jgi:hypothetical protein